MMRVLLLLFLGLISSSLVQAQRYNLDSLFVKNGMIGVEGGLSIPIMDYAANDMSNAAGYAKVGYQYRVSFGYEFSKFVGLKIMYLNNTNAKDNEAIYDNIAKGQSSTAVTKILSVKTGSHQLEGLMFGLYYPFRMAKTTYELKAMTGLLNAVLPEEQFVYSNSVTHTNTTLKVNEGKANNFGYMFGVGIRHQLVKNLLLTGSFDFLYAEQKFKHLTMSLSGTNGVVLLDDYTQYYHILAANIGLAIQFN